MCYPCSQKRRKGEVKSKRSQKCYARSFRTKTEWVRKLFSLMTFYSNRSDPLASRRFLCNCISCAFDYQNSRIVVKTWSLPEGNSRVVEPISPVRTWPGATYEDTVGGRSL